MIYKCSKIHQNNCSYIQVTKIRDQMSRASRVLSRSFVLKNSNSNLWSIGVRKWTVVPWGGRSWAPPENSDDATHCCHSNVNYKPKLLGEFHSSSVIRFVHSISNFIQTLLGKLSKLCWKIKFSGESLPKTCFRRKKPHALPTLLAKLVSRRQWPIVVGGNIVGGKRSTCGFSSPLMLFLTQMKYCRRRICTLYSGRGR